MTKINLDQLINTKLEGLNFEFKNDYWKQMEKEISSNCGAEVAGAGTGISTFLSSALIVSFISIITIILIFPWAYDFDNSVGTENATQKEIIIEEVIIPEIKTTTIKEVTTISSEEQNNTTVIKEEQIAPKVKIKKVRRSSSKKSKTISKKSRVSKSTKSKASSGNSDKEKSEKKVATTVESYDTTKKQTESLDTIIKEVIIPDSEFNKISDNDKKVLDSKTLINEEPVVYENDSIYIPNGILSGDKQAEERPNPQVEVEAGPKPVKTVKPRSKPIKHVFRKRRGILYRLGLRK